MTWFYSKNGQQLGPITEQDFAKKCKEGEILSTDLVWKEGMSEWKAMADVNRNSAKLIPPLPTPLQGSAMVKQPPTITSPPLPPHIPTYLWQSIVATLLCCMPFGVVAIVYAAQVESLIAVGDYVGAQSASDTAKIWVGVSVGVCVLLLLGCLILFGRFYIEHF